MSLRAKLIALFIVLGVVPIVGLGLFTYVRSMQAVEDLVAARTLGIAQRAADEIANRYALRQSDLLLLAENAETQRLYHARADGGPREMESALAAAEAYLRQAWRSVGASYRWAEFRDTAGALLYRLGERTSGSVVGLDEPIDPAHVLFVSRPIQDLDTQERMGTLRAAIRLQTLLPDEALQVAFGRSGYSAVIDRSSSRVLHHPRRAFVRQPVSMVTGPDAWDVEEARLAERTGRFTYREDDSSRVASFAALTDPPWTIVATASVGEFAPPFARTRLINLVLILLAAVVISVGFVLMTRRMTRSLGALTIAADEVARGNFAPELPPAGADEVGKLSRAFGLMVHQVRDMLHRIQESRHLAAVGAFASQLSHEIRNPLTSIKLNLQSLERDAAAERIPQEYADSINICLREVKRLDRVAGGVLSVARTRARSRVPCSVHVAVREALEALMPQLGDSCIDVRQNLRASRDTVIGDAEQLKGVFLNLFLNAVEAMPHGGSLEVATRLRDDDDARKPTIAVRVADTGPGIPPEIKDRVFDPFISTKEEGTGFGLALAMQAVEEHEGTLRLEDEPARELGAVFVVELPIGPEGDA